MDRGEQLFVPGNITFKQVSFSYGEKEILDDFNMEFKEGISTAVTGRTGCGKSTLIKLLL